MKIKKAILFLMLASPFVTSLLIPFQTTVGQPGSAQAAAGKNDEIGTLVTVLTGYQNQLDPLIQQAKVDLRGLYGVVDYGNADDIYAAIRKISVSVDAANGETYPISLLMAQIKQKYPDLKAVYNTGPSGVDASSLIENINRMLSSWNQSRTEQADHYLEKSESDLMMVGQGLEQLKIIPAQVRGSLASQHIGPLQSSKALLDIIPTLLPSPPGEVGKRTPEMETLVQKSNQLKGQYAEIEAQFAQISASAAKEVRQQLDASRFPQGVTHNGGDETEIKSAFSKQFSNTRIERMGIKHSWKQKEEAHWIGNSLVINTYKYIDAWIVHKIDSGKYRAYSMSFRKTLQSDGSWSDLAYWGAGHSYEILEENIHKG